MSISSWWRATEWPKAIVAVITAGVLSGLVTMAKTWADENYVSTKALAQNSLQRDLKNISDRLDELDMEIARVNIWVETLPGDEESLRTIYTLQLDVLERHKEKYVRKHLETIRLGATVD